MISVLGLAFFILYSELSDSSGFYLSPLPEYSVKYAMLKTRNFTDKEWLRVIKTFPSPLSLKFGIFRWLYCLKYLYIYMQIAKYRTSCLL